jgi:hypothetical protein
MEIRRPSGTWYDVFSFISLAAALGLVSGVALGAVALLLANPAYGADSGETKEAALVQGSAPTNAADIGPSDAIVDVEIEDRQTLRHDDADAPMGVECAWPAPERHLWVLERVRAGPAGP